MNYRREFKKFKYSLISAVQIAPVPADSIRCGVVSDEEEEDDDDDVEKEEEEGDVIATVAPGDRDISGRHDNDGKEQRFHADRYMFRKYM